MKNHKAYNIILMTLFAVFVSCNSACEEEKSLDPSIINNPVTADEAEKKRGSGPVMEFEESRHHFGEITEGEVVNHTFKFKNTGDADLLISAASGSCGCTVPEFSKEPIPPGGSGKIDVSFNSESRHGMQSKTVTVIANTVPNSKVLTISAEVLSKKE